MKLGYDGKRAVQNFTGLGNYSRYVIDSLVTYYATNEYILYAPKRRENKSLSIIEEKSSGSVCRRFPKKGFWSKFSSLWRVWGVTSDLHNDGVELFHGLSNELPLNIKGKVKSIVTIHDLIFLKYPQFYPVIDRWIYNFKFRRACHNANHIIAVSECTKRDIIEYYSISPEKISVIYQGCDNAFSAVIAKEQCEKVRLRYSLPEHFVLSVGTIEERKNLLSVVKALTKLPQEIHLVAVGRHTKYTDKVKKYISENNLQDRVHFLHGVTYTDLPVIYRCADVFAYMSVYEGFGIPLLEALYSSLPVVAATGSCLEEAGGPSSIYVSPYDVDAIAESIVQAMQPDIRAKMVEQGLEWASRFTPEAHAHKTMECYKKVINE